MSAYRRNYRRTYYTQDDINAGVQKIREQLTGLALRVLPNGDGYQIKCDVCGWSKCHGTIQGARDHAATH